MQLNRVFAVFILVVLVSVGGLFLYIQKSSKSL